MGGVSTSHSAVLRNGKTQSSSGFDLHSWQGLTEVLRVGKESLRDPLAYAEFRNLVLQYAQQGGDQELRKQIDAIVATFKKENNGAVSTEPKVETPKEVQSNPTPAPVKKEVAVEERKKESVPSPTRVEKAPIVGMRRTPPVFRGPTQPVVPTHEKVVLKEVPPPPPQTPSQPVVSKAAVVTPPEPPQTPKEEVIVPVQHTKVEVAPPQSVPSQFKTLEEHRARIAEIKRLVNTRIGNPTALIGTHNIDGRAYMSALLGALKATGGNGTEGVEGAMAKLEDAYTKIIANIDSGVKTTETPVAETPLAEKKIVEPAPISAPEPAKAEFVPQVQQVPRAEKVVIPPAPKKIIPETKEAEMKKYSVADTLTTLLTRNQNITQKIKTQPPQIPTQKVSVPTPPSREPKVAEVSSSATQTQTPFPTNKYTVKEVAKVHQNETLKKVAGIDPQHIATKQTELVSPEITQALNQLLHEWSIFSGSGFFGIGPGGAEHPLYIKLSSLSMGEVIAGRWDGADPKVTKTIKQYVDAWRHEQGIAYTINETFEHYLRRVVQRILKRQSN